MEADGGLWASPRARELVATGNIGGAIRLAREARGWRQADLGRRAGYSASTISRLEHSKRSRCEVGVIRHVASVAGIPDGVLSALLGLGGTTVSGIISHQAEEDDPVRRRRFLSLPSLAVPLQLTTKLDDALALLPAPVRATSAGEFAARLASARRQFDNGVLNRLVAAIPDLLSTAHDAADRHNTPLANRQLAACYDLATEVLNKMGRFDSSRITADRATLYSAMSGSAIAMSASARVLGIVLRHEGREAIADQVTLAAACRLEKTGLVTPAEAAAYAQMLCSCAYNASQAGDRERAIELIVEAERAARRLPERPVPGQPFTVTLATVRLYRVGVHWSLNDPGAALDVGKSLRPDQFTTRERRSRLHTDLARAWWMWGKPEQAARQLLAAHQQVPAEVRDRPSIRTIVDKLAARHPHVPGVSRLVAAVGGRS